MFNDKYGLTQAVLNGTKMQTRRLVKNGVPLGNYEEAMTHSTYKVGEVVAVAQSYLDVRKPQFDKFGNDVAGNTNKLFVKAELMPYHIKITNVRVQKLQDITDEECLLEGIYVSKPLPYNRKMDGYSYDASKDLNKKKWWYRTPREAYAALIDKISGKGTWESNPYVFAYNFELVNINHDGGKQ